MDERRAADKMQLEQMACKTLDDCMEALIRYLITTDFSLLSLTTSCSSKAS